MNDELDLEKVLEEPSLNEPMLESLIDDTINQLAIAEQNDIVKVEGTEIILSSEFSAAFKLINQLSQKCSDALKIAKNMLLEEMKKAYLQTGGQKAQNNGVSITYKIPTAKETFDLEKFKLDFPDLYRKYLNTSLVKESILVKIKGDK